MMPDAPEAITVVLVHRDRPDVIATTVAAFSDQSVATSVQVVDNDSGLVTPTALAALIEPAVLTSTGKNLGFGPGANVGLRTWLRHETGEWAVVAPHDAVPEGDTLEKMLAAVIDRPFVGLVSADVGDDARPMIDEFLGPIDAPVTVAEGLQLADYPHGTLMMLRRTCVEEVGLFDERYFSYCEESELALRAAAAGWQCGVVRGAMVHNPGMSASIERVAYLQLRNTLLMLREHFGRRNAWFRIGVALVQLPLGMVYPPARGLHWSPRGRLLAIRDYVRGRYGPPPTDVN